MGRALLTRALGALALLLVAGCTAGEPEAVATGQHDTAAAVLASDSTDGHAGMACASCHSGAQADSGLAAVPRTTCLSAKCHADGGPLNVRSGSITFPHRNHGQEGDVAASCAGCHDHHSATEALHVDVDACALCHVADVSGRESGDCRKCHQSPEHVAFTSQALPIPHSALPWVETGCVRCHYDVSEPLVKVSSQRCARCHEDLEQVTADGIGANLHPQHEGVSCVRCHESGAHRVQALSSAVALVCADCHTREHDIALAEQWPESGVCTNCHRTVHQEQQQLLLGMGFADDAATAAPSTKFLAGVTCRSCHFRAEGAGADTVAIRGQAEACAGCHRTEYRRVLDWWIEGARVRAGELLAFGAAAERDLASGPDTARHLVATAREMVALVDRAGGQHNLELADRIFRDSRRRILDAYRLAGRPAPAAPGLGATAHEGLCSYCHYAPGDSWNFRQMPADFHAQVMGPAFQKK